MKRTWELTSIHYRRSVKRPATPDIQSLDHCPVCGTPLEAIRVNNPEARGGLKAAQSIVFRVAQQESGERPDEDSGN